MVTLSGIFRDLLPLQIKLMAEAAYLAASADEPLEQNFVRKHALRYQDEHQCDLETAALRVYGNAESTYGANVNLLVQDGCWDKTEELAETYTRRKSFAYGRSGRPVQKTQLLTSILADVQLTYQNLDSVELGVTTVEPTSTRSAESIAPCVAPREASRHPCISLTTRVVRARYARSLSKLRSRRARVRSIRSGTRACSSMAMRACARSRRTSPIPWAGQPPRGKYNPGVSTAHRDFHLDSAMRARLARLNPTASAKVANRLLEASARKYWQPDDQMLEELKSAGAELEDRLEGIYEGVAA